MFKKNLDCLEETIGRNMDVTGDSREVSDGRKGNPYHKVAKILAALCSSVL